MGDFRKSFCEKCRRAVVKTETPTLGTVYLLSPSVVLRDRFVELSNAKDKSTPAFLIANAVCDEAGALVFGEDDYGEILSWTATAVDELLEVILDKLLKVDPEKIEEAKKKSLPTPSFTSNSSGQEATA